MWGHGYGNMMGEFGGMWLLGLVALAFVAAIVFAAVRLSSRTPRQGEASGVAKPSERASGGARAILEERYARGEIDTEEFTDRLQHLAGPD